MAAVEEVIRRLVVEAETRGFDKVAGQFRATAQAFEAIADSGVMVGKVTTEVESKVSSVANAFGRTASRLDPFRREMEGVAKDLDVLRRAVSQGLASPADFQGLAVARIKQTSAYKQEVDRVTESLKEQDDAYTRSLAQRTETQAAQRTQAGAGFRADLEGRLGITSEPRSGAARQSAAVFEESFKQQQTLTDQIDRRLAETAAQRARRAQEHAAYEEKILTIKQQQNAVDAQTRIAASYGIRDQAPKGVEASASASVFAGSFKVQEQSARRVTESLAAQRTEYEGMVRAANEIRQRTDPQGEAKARFVESSANLQKLQERGLISQQHYNKELDNFRLKMDASTKGIGLNASAYQNLGYQVNDVISGLVMGQSPFTILAQQGGQFYQILAQQGGGGIVSGLKNMGGYLRTLITPAVAVGGAFAALAAASGLALNRFVEGEGRVTAALGGLGRGVGMTTAQFRLMAEAAGAAGKLSSNESEALGVALARTGRLGAENIGTLIRLSKDFATTMGTDMEGAKQQLTSLFADPGSGIQKLQSQFGLLDGKTREYVETLIRMGREQEAIRITLEKLPDALSKYSDSTTRISSAWEGLKNAISNADRAVGSFFANLGREGTGQERAMAAAAQRVEQVRLAAVSQRPGSEGPPRAPSAVSRFTGRDVGGGAAPMVPLPPVDARRAESMDMASLRRGLENRVDARVQEDLIAQAEALRKATEGFRAFDIEAKKSVTSQKIIKEALDSTNPAYRQQINDILEAGAREKDLNKIHAELEHANRTRLNTDERLTQQQAIELEGKKNLTKAQQNDLDVRKRTLDQAGQLMTQGRAEIDQNHERAMGRQAVISQTELMIRAQTHEEAAVRKEIAMIGMSGQKREEALAVMRAEQTLIEAGLSTTDKLSQAYIENARALAALNTERKLAQLSSDLTFDREQMGRSPIEQQVASRGRGVGMDYESFSNSARGAQVRLNEQLKITRDLGSEAMKGIYSDMRNGVSATEALTNALSRMGDKLANLAMDQALSGLFGTGGGSSGGLGGWLSTLGRGSSGLATVRQGGMGPDIPAGLLASVNHRGGTVGSGGDSRYVHPAYFDDAPRYHNGLGLRAGERPAILEDGELVIPRQMVPQMRSGGSEGGMGSAPVTVIDQRTMAASAPEIRQTQGGGTEIILKDAENAMVGRAVSGRGALAPALSNPAMRRG